jgi:hypothetical protein
MPKRHEYFATTAILALSLVLPATVMQARAASSRSAESKSTSKVEKTKATHHRNSEILGQAETLTGTITAVDHARRLVVLEDSDGVPLDLRVTGTTHIMAANNARRTRSELANDVGRRVSVKLVPERSGDFAMDIHFGAS